jgi:hypothetical protein
VNIHENSCNRRAALVTGCFTGLFALAPGAPAQSYPEKPLRIILLQGK